MTKEQFIQLVKDMNKQAPDKKLRLNFMFNEFKKLGLTEIDGLTATNYFYNELKKGFEDKDSIYKGAFIIDKKDNYAAFVSKVLTTGRNMKISLDFYNEMGIYFSVEKTVKDLEKLKDFNELFLKKCRDQSWPVGAIPETALEITEIEILFKYWKQIIQETINAAPDKQKEINNYLNLCDMGISTILPKCKDPYENKEINEYWLSQYEALKIFVAAFERHIPKTSAAEPLKEDEAEVETTEQKVRRLLKPLTEKGSNGTVILDNDNFEILVNAYVNWIEKQELPKPQNVIFYGSNPEFYGTLKELHREMNIPNDKEICDVLQNLLTKNNSKGQRGQRVYSSTIEKNLRTKYKK